MKRYNGRATTRQMRALTEAEIKRIERAYLDGVLTKDLEGRFHLSSNTINKLMRERGIPARSAWAMVGS